MKLAMQLRAMMNADGVTVTALVNRTGLTRKRVLAILNDESQSKLNDLKLIALALNLTLTFKTTGE